MEVRASVQVADPDHPRHNQAGVVESIDGDTCAVRFDQAEPGSSELGPVESLPVASLIELGAN